MKSQIIKGVRAMAAIPFFPTDEYAQQAIMTEIGKFVDREDGLKWLFDAAMNTMRKWEGIPELRGLYCTRFKPADGVEAISTLPGYSPVDCENAHIEQGRQYAQLDQPRTGQLRRIGVKI